MQKLFRITGQSFFGKIKGIISQTVPPKRLDTLPQIFSNEMLLIHFVTWLEQITETINKLSQLNQLFLSTRLKGRWGRIAECTTVTFLLRRSSRSKMCSGKTWEIITIWEKCSLWKRKKIGKVLSKECFKWYTILQRTYEVLVCLSCQHLYTVNVVSKCIFLIKLKVIVLLTIIICFYCPVFLCGSIWLKQCDMLLSLVNVTLKLSCMELWCVFVKCDVWNVS